MTRKRPFDATIQKGEPHALRIIDLAKVRCNFGEILRIRSAVNELVTVVTREQTTIRVRFLTKLEDGTFVPSHIHEELHADDLLLNAIARAVKAEASAEHWKDLQNEQYKTLMSRVDGLREKLAELHDDKARLDWLGENQVDISRVDCSPVAWTSA